MGLSKNQLKIIELLPSDEENGVEIPDELAEKCRFCPKCGSKDTHSTGNMASYPDCWEKLFCANCGFLLGLVDNSPFMGWYEFKHNDFVIDF